MSKHDIFNRKIMRKKRKRTKNKKLSSTNMNERVI